MEYFAPNSWAEQRKREQQPWKNRKMTFRQKNLEAKKTRKTRKEKNQKEKQKSQLS